MLANWVKETTATTGTGAITLGGAPAGFVPFSAAFADNSPVYYVIEDGNNRETGLGVYSAGTLTRTTVLETLSAGTFDDRSPAALSLSGSAVVIVAATHRSAGEQILGHNSGQALYPHTLRGRRAATAAMTADRLYFVPMYIPAPGTFNGVSIYVGTAAGTNMLGGLYTMGADGMPHRLLFEGAAMDPSTTGMKTGTTASPVNVRAGWHFAALVINGAASVSSRGRDDAAFSPLGTDGDFNGYWKTHAYQGLTAGWTQLPATASAVRGEHVFPVVGVLSA